jgi:hypothetical protein
MNKILKRLGTDTKECRDVGIIFAIITLVAFLMEVLH